MLNLSKRDWLSLAGVAVVVSVLVLGGMREKARQVPFDDRHRPFFAAPEKGRDRQEAEKDCVVCHSAPALPLPGKHPPKEQCLLCHKLSPHQ